MPSFVDDILEGVLVLDRDLRAVYVNHAAARLRRTTREAMLGRTLAQCHPDSEQGPLHRALQSCLADREPRILEDAFTLPDGSIGCLELRVQPVPEGVCLLSIEISERKHAEAALRSTTQSQSSGASADPVGQLAANLAREFNNVLGAIIGYAGVGLSRPATEAASYFKQILAVGRRGAALANQLRVCGSHQAMHDLHADVAAVITAMEPRLRRLAGDRIQLEFRLAADAGRVRADPSKIGQIVEHLVCNARDATAGHGRIVVAVHSATAPARRIGGADMAAPVPMVLLRVTDDGRGGEDATITPNPYAHAASGPHNTSMGLSVVCGLVHQCEGEIQVDGKPGRGTTIEVRLPVAGAGTGS